MAWWSNLAGTVSGYIRLGLTGPRLKNDVGVLAVRNAGDTAAAALTASTITGDLVPTNGPFAHRNKIINGNFDIWQRGTSQTAGGYGSDDRWRNDNFGSTKTHSQQAFALGQTDVPGEPTYFSRTIVTSVAAAGNFCLKYQPIEDVRTLAGKNATITFWAKADAAKNIALEFAQNFGSGGTPSAQVEAIGAQLIPLTTVWQKFTRTIAIPSLAGKVVGTDNNHALRAVFWFDAGSTHNARTASLGQQSGTFDIAQVQVEEGSVATPFEQRPIGYELSLCQRYYEIVKGVVITASGIYKDYYCKVTKRATPTVTVTISTGTGATFVVIDTERFYQEATNSAASNFTATVSAEL